MTELEPQPRLIINVNKQRDGYIFDLRPRSRVWLETNYPDRERVSSVFIGADRKSQFEQFSDSILRQVLNLITGLSLEELNSVGGFRLINPVTDEELLNPTLAYV